MAEKTERLAAHIEAYVDTGAFIACGLYVLKMFPKRRNWSTDRHLSLTGRKLIID